MAGAKSDVSAESAGRAERVGLWSGLDRGLTRDRLWRYPLALFVVTVLVYGVQISRSRGLIEPGGKIIGHDFLAFYMAGDMVRDGQVDALYSVSGQQSYQRRFMADNPQWEGTCLYLNPPHYAWAMSWLAGLRYGWALAAWWTLALACFAGTVLMWRRWLAGEDFALALTLAVCMPAWFQAFAGGQNTFLTLLILTGFCALLLSGRQVWAGVVLSLLAYKFHLLAVPCGFLLLTGRWRTLAGVAGGLAATAALTIATTGWASVADYVRFGSQLGRLMDHTGFDIHKQHSWYGFFYVLGSRWLGLSWIQGLAAVASAGTLILAGWFWRRGAPLAAGLGAVLVATAATSPHLFHYDMLILALPAVLWVSTCGAFSDVAATAVRLRVLWAAGFVWLAVGPMITSAVPVQLSPVLMTAWLVVMIRCRAGIRDEPLDASAFILHATCGKADRESLRRRTDKCRVPCVPRDA